jgi:hypothetical protein
VRKIHNLRQVCCLMDENIFEAAGRQGKPRKDKASSGRTEGSSVKKNDGLVDPEISAMLDKMKSMKDDLENQLSSVYQKGRESKVNVSLMIESASALTNAQLEKMKEQEKLLSDKINAVIPAESCLKKPLKSKEKMTQERQGKLRGARNNWIPVR